MLVQNIEIIKYSNKIITVAKFEKPHKFSLKKMSHHKKKQITFNISVNP